MDFESSCNFMYSQMNKLDNNQKLIMYALYKQATVGNAPSTPPNRLKVLEYAKWEAWNKIRGIESIDSKNEYIKIANNVLSNSENNKNAY